MKIQLKREPSKGDFTQGEIWIDGKFECYSVEDVVRTGEKVHGKTAIPFGTYEVVVTMSARFKQPLPLLVDVPGFAGIRIHPGNTAKDTEGCILPGLQKTPTGVGGSRVAFARLFKKIQAELAAGRKVSIEIVNV